MIKSILDAALDDDHKHQAAAWKIVTDRIIPVSHFDKMANQKGSGGISISITSLGGEVSVVGEENEVVSEQ